MNKKDIIIDYNLDKNGSKTLKYIDIITKSHPIEPVILLPQIPNEFNKIEVIFDNKHLIKVDKIRDLDNINKIYIDYSKQKIYIHKDLMHKDLKVRYSGIGALKFDINNINYNQEDKLSIIESIDKVANNGEKIFEECLSEGFVDKQEVLNELLTKIALGNKSIKDIDNVIKNIDLDNIANNMTNSTTKIDNIEQEIVKARSNKSNVKTRLDIQENNINECKDELNGINDRLSLIKTNIENLTINIGDLALLKTKNKKNIVEALNELAEKIGIIVVPPKKREPSEWNILANIITPRVRMSSVVIGNKIYCIGGQSSIGTVTTVESFDIVSNYWNTETSLQYQRTGATSQFINNKIYTFGGHNGETTVNTVECYDIETNTITTKTNMPYCTVGATSHIVNGLIYIIGGYSNNDGINVIQIYNPDTDTWSVKNGMSISRRYFESVLIDNKIYCFGGYNGITVFNTVECYDISTETWSVKANMPIAKQNFGCAKFGDYVYIIGGDNLTTVFDSIEIYNYKNDTWETFEMTMPEARADFVYEVIDNKIYCISGTNANGLVATNEVFE